MFCVTKTKNIFMLTIIFAVKNMLKQFLYCVNNIFINLPKWTKDFFADAREDGNDRIILQFYSHSSQYLVRNAAIVTNDWMNDLECIEYKEGIFSNFLNGPSPASYFLQKCENRLSSIRQQESNSHILDDESPPLTTRPGLPPIQQWFLPISKQTPNW